MKREILFHQYLLSGCEEIMSFYDYERLVMQKQEQRNETEEDNNDAPKRQTDLNQIGG